MEIGLHYPLHVLNKFSLPEMLSFIKYASDVLKPFNFTQVWTNDNLEYRNIFVSSAAIATSFPLKLGTAITFPYARNPVDVAGGYAAVSELMNGREVSVGVGAGTKAILGQQVELKNQVTMCEEFLICLRKLFAGVEVLRSEFPNLADHFHMKAEKYKLRFQAQNIKLYYGGHGTPGPKIAKVVGLRCDGVILGTRLKDAQEFSTAISNIEEARANSQLGKEPLRKIMMLDASISRDRDAARNHARRFISHVLSAERDDYLTKKGIDPSKLKDLREAFAKNRGIDEAQKKTPDDFVDRVVIAGTPRDSLERIAEWFKYARENNFSQIFIGVPIGPDVREAIELWAKDILPHLDLA
jgi:5,10-methylenetetrahydromethanopterin reductase